MKNRQIKLLFIVNSLQFGGAEKHVVTLLNRLDTARFRLSLAYLKDIGTLLPQLDRRNLEDRVFCCHVSGKADWRAVHQLAASIRDDEVDIVVCTNTYSLLHGWLARLLSGRHPRLVEVFHTTVLRSLKEKLQMLFYRPLFTRCDMLVHVCESQRQYWRTRALRAKRDIVIHNGVDIGHFSDRYSPEYKTSLRQSFGFSADDYVVGLCAAMRPEKAHGDLLRAVAHLTGSGTGIKCLLIGDGPERPAVERQIRAMGLTQHVRITGFMEDVRPLVAACDAMTIVSHHIETFSIAALEAMALGKPMVMSRIGGAAEQVIHGESGYLYPRGDIDALADALRRLSDRQQCKRMGACAQSLAAQRFSVEGMVEAYARLFSDLMQTQFSNTAGAEHGNPA